MHVEIGGDFAFVVVERDRLLSGAMLGAMIEGLYEGGDKVRTRVRRALREQTNVKRYGAIVERTPSQRGGLTYRIKGLKKALPIEEFPVELGEHGVVAEPWGVEHAFKRSFFNHGYRARLTSDRFPIRRLFGPNIAKEIYEDHSVSTFEAGVRGEVLPAIERRLARVFA